jgi:hypothetical protein
MPVHHVVDRLYIHAAQSMSTYLWGKRWLLQPAIATFENKTMEEAHPAPDSHLYFKMPNTRQLLRRQFHL